MKVIIAGGRDFDNKQMINEAMAQLNILVTEIVCGDAAGADTLGAVWANENGIPVKHFPADWDRYGSAAGSIRNKQMAEYADYLVAFWDMKSSGTRDMITQMQQIGKHGTVVPYEIRNKPSF